MAGFSRVTTAEGRVHALYGTFHLSWLRHGGDGCMRINASGGRCAARGDTHRPACYRPELCSSGPCHRPEDDAVVRNEAPNITSAMSGRSSVPYNPHSFAETAVNVDAYKHLDPDILD